MKIINKLSRKIQSMTVEEIYSAIYRDSLTGLQNRAAFEESYQDPIYNFVAVVDMDSLKYLNDEYGHRVGDSYLKQLANNLAEHLGDHLVFRLSGDEFAILHTQGLPLRADLNSTREVFPCFSFGVGRTLESADLDLKLNKLEREKAGLRAPRGERPPWENLRAEEANEAVELMRRK